MATEKLLPNAKTGWSGPVTNIDEGIASADGLVVSVGSQAFITVDFDDSAVLDGDTVTLVRPTIRARSTTLSGTDTLNVDLFIDGVKKGTTQTFALTSSFVNHTYNNSGWDVDWTEVQMDGIQLKIRALHTNGAEPDPPAPKIDAIDLNITFTLGPINHTITGDVTTTFTPAATLDFQRHASITGNITTSFTPTATLAFNKNHVLVGDVTTTFTPAATLDFQKHRSLSGAVTTNFNPDATFDFTVAGGVNELLAPDVKISDTGHSACLLSDLTADDANWCLANTKTSNTVTHVDFPAPTNLLQIGAGFQKIKAIVRQSSLNDPSSPQARIELWENGLLIRAGSNQNVPATGTRTLILGFNANELTDQHGQLVQVKVITTADSEPGFSGAVDTGFIEFNARFIPINNNAIVGAVTTTFTPAATLQFQQHPAITGNVTTSFTPAATLDFTLHTAITGNVTTSFSPAATLDFQKHRAFVGAVTTSFTSDATFDFTVGGGVTEALAPDTKIADSGHSACLLSDLTADDANWCLAATKTASTVSHVGFPIPSELLEIGDNKQKVEAIVRQSSLNDPSIPSARIEVWENNTLILAGPNKTVPPTGIRRLSLTFNASLLTLTSGLNVEVKVITTADTEPGFSGSVDTGFISFTARLATVHTIVGAITTNFTPAATTEYRRRIIGNITTTFTPAATIVKGKKIVGVITTSFTPEANFDLTIGGGNIEVLAPDTKIADSGHLACLLSDLTADDANWCIAAGKTFSTISHVGFPTPTELLEIGANKQKITAIVRQFSGNDPAIPTARIELWENGSLVRAGPNQSVFPTGTKTLTFNFNANELADTSGVNAEAKVITVADTEPGFSGAVDTGFISFSARLAKVHTLVGAITTSFTPAATTEYRSRIVGNITTTFVPAATFDFTRHAAITGNISTFFTPNAQTEFSLFGGIRETLVPDGLIADSGHSSCLLSDLTADDGNWCLAAGKTFSTVSHVDFPTPTNPLDPGVNFQKLIAIVRQNAGNDPSIPSARIELWENGSLVRAGPNQSVGPTGTKTLVLLFNANELSNIDGSLIQVKVITTADTEPGFSGAIDTGYIAFDAKLNPAARAIIGNVTTSFTPAATLVKGKVIVGSVSTTFTPAATMEHQRHFAVVGAVTTTFTPAGTFEYRNRIIGNITTTFVPAALLDFTRHASFLGAITVTFTPAAALLFSGLPQFRKASTEKLQIVRLTAKRRFKFFNTRSQ